MSFLKLFFPQIIKLPDSKYNKNLVIVDYFYSTTLLSDGLIESGDIMRQIWGAGIKNLIPKHFTPQSILLLGLAGGSNAKLVSKLYPQAQITAVEIDPYMVEIGKKFFGLNKVRNLKIVIADALPFVHNLTSEIYDLILVDCFEGKYIPQKLENLDFIGKLKEHSRHTLINRIAWFEYKEPSLSFMRSLATRFFFVKTHTRSNLIISLV